MGHITIGVPAPVDTDANGRTACLFSASVSLFGYYNFSTKNGIRPGGIRLTLEKGNDVNRDLCSHQPLCWYPWGDRRQFANI